MCDWHITCHLFIVYALFLCRFFFTQASERMHSFVHPVPLHEYRSVECCRCIPSLTRLSGPILPEPAKLLPADLEEWMNNSPNGVLLVSLGTLAEVVLTEQTVNTLASVFSALPLNVLWKLSRTIPANVGSNVKIVKWFPQNDLLGHPKTRVFFTHGGMNSVQVGCLCPLSAPRLLSISVLMSCPFSVAGRHASVSLDRVCVWCVCGVCACVCVFLCVCVCVLCAVCSDKLALIVAQEAAYHGVPMLGFPQFADQFDNIIRMVSAGTSIEIRGEDFEEALLKEKILELLNDPRCAWL